MDSKLIIEINTAKRHDNFFCIFMILSLVFDKGYRDVGVLNIRHPVVDVRILLPFCISYISKTAIV